MAVWNQLPCEQGVHFVIHFHHGDSLHLCVSCKWCLSVAGFKLQWVAFNVWSTIVHAGSMLYTAPLLWELGRTALRYCGYGELLSECYIDQMSRCILLVSALGINPFQNLTDIRRAAHFLIVVLLGMKHMFIVCMPWQHGLCFQVLSTTSARVQCLSTWQFCCLNTI